MKTLNSIILLFISIYFVSCAQEAPKTKAKISIGAISGDSFSGGLYIIGHKVPSKDLKDDFHPDERVFLTRITGESFEKELPNGFWEFGAFGWKGNSRMTGMLKCFITPRVLELNGEEVDVTLSLSEAGCNEDLFGDPETKIAQTSQPKKLAFKSCAIVGELAEENECIEGTANSFKFEFYDVNFAHPEEMHVQRQNPFLTKRCYTKDSITDLSFPAFRGFPIGVKSYTDSNCSQNVRYTLLRHGFENRYANNIDRVHILDDRINILVPSDVCADPSTIHSATILPKNDATAVTAQFICNKSQFQSMSSSGTYVLARDIDFRGSNTTKSNFSGSLYGNNKTLKNANNPLFGELHSGFNIQNLKLENFDISQSSNSLGALANSIYISSSSENQIHDIDLINIKIVNTMNSTDKTGGLIGAINNESSVSTLKISNIRGFKSISISGNNHVGGIIGSSLQSSTINHFSNLEFDKTDAVMISGNDHIGGFFGSVNDSIVQYSQFKGAVSGGRFLGGIAGSLKDASVNEVFVDISFHTNDSCQFLGGIAGKSTSANSDIIASNLISQTKLLSQNRTDASSSFCREVGGVYGSYLDNFSDNSRTLTVLNTKSNLNSDFSDNNNQYFGGLIGSFQNKDNSARLENNITGLKVGTVDYAGGIIGKAYCIIPASPANNYCENSEIKLIRQTISKFDESSGSKTNSGAIIGSNNVFIVDQIVAYAPESSYQLVGTSEALNNNGDPAASPYNYKVFFADNATPVIMPNSSQNPAIWNNNQLIFETALYALSGEETLSNGLKNYKIGNSFEPLEIRSTTQWNLLADKQFLLSKSLKLMNDLDFSGIQFKPLGDGPNVNPLMFTGRLIPNSKKLRNIYFQINDNYTALGVVRNAGVFNGPKAQIGSSQDPLIVEGLEFDLNGQPATAIGSVAGTVSKADIHARVYQANIHNAGTGSGSIGGLVGYIEQEAHIADSEFNGSIDVTNANSVGGLIGSMSGDNLNFLDIHSSKVSTSRLQGNSTTTGFLIGNVTNSNQVHIKGNYINVFDTNTDTASFISNNAPAINFERNILHLLVTLV